MRELNTRLTILHDDNGTFEDHSNAAHSYLRDNFVLDFIQAEDKLYVGYRKPINVVYVAFDTANTSAASLTLEYFKAGSTNAFTAVGDHIDDTKGMTRSGFITWERNLEDEDETTINSVEQYWYRLSWDVDLDVGTSIKGINIVFADDQDLRAIVPSISQTKFLSSGESDHILSHVAARDHILKRLSQDGRLKANFSTGRLTELNQFDMLNIEQLNEAAKYKALSLIYDDLSDEPDDNYEKRARYFEDEFEAAYNNLTFLNVDWDDDGKSDRFEELNSASSVILRR